MRLRSLKEVKIILKSYNGTTGKRLVSIVMLKIYLFSHLVTEVNSKFITLSVYSVVFKRLKNAPFSPFSVERPVVAGRVL